MIRTIDNDVIQKSCTICKRFPWKDLTFFIVGKFFLSSKMRKSMKNKRFLQDVAENCFEFKETVELFVCILKTAGVRKGLMTFKEKKRLRTEVHETWTIESFFLFSCRVTNYENFNKRKFHKWRKLWNDQVSVANFSMKKHYFCCFFNSLTSQTTFLRDLTFVCFYFYENVFLPDWFIFHLNIFMLWNIKFMLEFV